MIEIDMRDLDKAIKKAAKAFGNDKVIKAMGQEMSRTMKSARSYYTKHSKTGLKAKFLKNRVRIRTIRGEGVGVISIAATHGVISASRVRVTAKRGNIVTLRGAKGFRQTIRNARIRRGRYTTNLVVQEQDGARKGGVPQLLDVNASEELLRIAPGMLNYVLPKHTQRLLRRLSHGLR